MPNQYYARVKYTADGTTDTFAVPFPYLSRTHVEAVLNTGSVLVEWQTDGTISTFPAPDAGDVIEIRRNTPLDSRLVDFTDGARLVENDLDTDSLQVFYALQEYKDFTTAAVSGDIFSIDDIGTTTLVQDIIDQVTQSQLYQDLGSQIGELDLTAESVIENALSAAQENERTAFGLAAVKNGNSAAFLQEQTVRADADSALASDLTALTATVGGNTSLIVSEQTTRADADSAIASDVTTLQTTVGDNTTSIQTQATSVNGLEAQYTVKIDSNGYVSGFGLAQHPVTTVDPLVSAKWTSEFVVRADKFAVAAPDGSGEKVPFVIDTQSGIVGIDGNLAVTGSINGIAIKDGEIGLSKLKATELAADIGNFGTLTGGTIKTAPSGYRVELSKDGNYPIWYGTGTKTFGNAKFYVDKQGNAVFKGQLSAATGSFNGTITAAGGNFTVDATGHMEAKGMTLRKTDGTVIMDASGNINQSYISGLGLFASLNAKLSSANISTYMSSAAITSAYIGNAAITTAKIGNAAVDTLRIAGNAVTVPTVTTHLNVVADGDNDYNYYYAYTNTDSSPTFIYAVLEHGTSTSNFNIRFTRNGVLKRAVPIGGVSSTGLQSAIFTYMDASPPAGTVTYGIGLNYAGIVDLTVNKLTIVTYSLKR